MAPRLNTFDKRWPLYYPHNAVLIKASISIKGNITTIDDDVTRPIIWIHRIAPNLNGDGI